MLPFQSLVNVYENNVTFTIMATSHIPCYDTKLVIATWVATQMTVGLAILHLVMHPLLFKHLLLMCKLVICSVECTFNKYNS